MRTRRHSCLSVSPSFRHAVVLLPAKTMLFFLLNRTFALCHPSIPLPPSPTVFGEKKRFGRLCRDDRDGRGSSDLKAVPSVEGDKSLASLLKTSPVPLTLGSNGNTLPYRRPRCRRLCYYLHRCHRHSLRWRKDCQIVKDSTVENVAGTEARCLRGRAFPCRKRKQP